MTCTKYDRHGMLFLSVVAILLALLSIGCSKNNESRIIGHWKVKSMNSVDGGIQNVVINFQEKGAVSKTTEIIVSEDLSRTNKVSGRYKFSDDKINISITWNDGQSEVESVKFPDENKMLLGKLELEKIQ